VCKKARLYGFIKWLPKKFDTELGFRGAMLSTGERQRISIARALLKKAEILILDEATSSQDIKTEHLIQEAISHAIKQQTVIAIAHRFSTISQANRIMFMENGEIIERGKVGKLLELKGKFYEYWQKQYAADLKN